MNETVPAVLYKYRRFDARTIKLICADQLYFADPNTFNDPLDCQPCVEADCDVSTLEQTLHELVRRRVEGEMRAGALAVKYRGPKTISHINNHSLDAAKKAIEWVQYEATDQYLSDDPTGTHASVLTRRIENELLRQYNKGILSLASRHDCHLMWSHYADQHRGLCIGYSVPEEARTQFHKVKYGGNRNVKASDVAAMLSGDAQARAAVDEAVLLRKAPAWSYENEWRMLGTRGADNSTLEMAEIVFGIRCEATVMHTVAAALKGRKKHVELFEMHEVRGTFKLRRREVDVEELSISYPTRALSAFEGFEVLDSVGDGSSA